MTKMKKLVSLMLAALMLLSMMSVAGAEVATKGKITVQNAVPGFTYNVYRIFDLEYNEESGAYRYTIDANSSWYEFVTEEAANYITLTPASDAEGSTLHYVTWNGENSTTRAAGFAAEAISWIEVKEISSDKTLMASDEGETTDLYFEELPLGYYLVDSSMGALCALNTTATEVTVTEKNEKPTIEKQVQEDSLVNEENEGWGDSNTADMNQTVNFRAIITVQKGAEKYMMHDFMDSVAFENIKVTKVEAVRAVGDATVSAEGNRDYIVTMQPTPHKVQDKACTFEVRIADTFVQNLSADDKIYIYYSATLKDTADIGSNGSNLNEVCLEYGDDHYTEFDQTKTYTFDLSIFKYANKVSDTGDSATTVEQPLSGAEFELRRESAEGEAVKVVTSEETENYDYTVSNAEGASTTLVSDKDGYIKIEGLDAGTYYLQETRAPAGYSLLSDAIKIVISESGTVSMPDEDSADDDTVDTVKVLNQSGATLPSTGGIGTTIFYAVGGLLVVLAVVLLVTKRRVSEDG